MFIRFNKDGMLAFRTIMPLVLITFVENIIKHGDLQDIENPAVIDMKVNNQGLLFFTHNKKRNGPKEKSTGIGLQNTINRLNLGYGNDGYHLEIDETDLFYTVNLRIKI
ncbi:hypothetical protein ACFFJX_30445 [Pseudarcicella hirudinis]|uniref:hypothetical protein n=1 Tax=Pseudarcicella hirudinis TaxID=1079859 RepID=UPI0035EB09B0